MNTCCDNCNDPLTGAAFLSADKRLLCLACLALLIAGKLDAKDEQPCFVN
jgi:hypothetical protein